MTRLAGTCGSHSNKAGSRNKLSCALIAQRAFQIAVSETSVLTHKRIRAGAFAGFDRLQYAAMVVLSDHEHGLSFGQSRLHHYEGAR